MWDSKCIAAAVCFTTSNILYVIHGALMMKQNSSSSQKIADGNDATIFNGVYDDNNNYNQAQTQSQYHPMNFNFTHWKDLDPIYIQSRWIQREDSRALMMSAALFGTLAWFFLMVPIVQSAWILSRGGRRLVGPHLLMASLGVVGGIIELLTRLIAVGMNNAQEWLAKDFNLSDWGSEGESSGDGWRVLEMIHIVTRGMLLWIDSFEALAIFGIVVIIWYSVGLEPKFKSVKRSLSVDTGVVASSPESENAIIIEDEAEESLDDDSQEVPTTQQPPSSAFAAVSATTKVAVKPTFTKCFTYYGLFVGFLSAIDFVAAVLRFINWPLFGRIAMVTQTLVGVIFLPIWLLIFAKQLGRATDSFEREEQRRVHLDGCTDDEVTGLLA
ncbi:hypothetical protein QTG54_009999 [Skeletonema marinoi]|uniref:Uncharacterized protein n=1 Tax=Skeletonema marinoi TaxID=267567 RepID=A0AAD8Y690_9STRA|nr:hypothetical protein QTG54_009999 [Skeletonema marinoi]